MTAENVLPIIKALDAKEHQRLMQMLGVGAEKTSSTKTKHYIERDIRQRLLSTIFKPRRV